MLVEENNRLESLGIPNSGGRIPAARHQAMAFRVPSQGLDAVSMTFKSAGQTACLQIPKTDHAIFSRRSQQGAGVIQGQRADRPLRPRKFAAKTPAGHLPHANDAIVVSGGQQLGLRPKSHGRHPGRLRNRIEDLSAAHLPQRHIVGRRSNQTGVRADRPQGF